MKAYTLVLLFLACFVALAYAVGQNPVGPDAAKGDVLNGGRCCCWDEDTRQCRGFGEWCCWGNKIEGQQTEHYKGIEAAAAPTPVAAAAQQIEIAAPPSAFPEGKKGSVIEGGRCCCLDETEKKCRGYGQFCCY